jgi:hypothetical protein
MEDTNKDARAAVAALLAGAGIIFNVSHAGARPTGFDGKPWDCDAWFCTFRATRRTGDVLESFDYYTGSGHRKPAAMPEHVRAMRPYSIGRQNWERANPGRAVAPQAADVLYSLLLDSSAVGQSFESWASDFGHDTDSRAAEATYRACQQNADKLARVIDATTRAELSRILEGF